MNAGKEKGKNGKEKRSKLAILIVSFSSLKRKVYANTTWRIFMLIFCGLRSYLKIAICNVIIIVIILLFCNQFFFYFFYRKKIEISP